MTVTRRKFFSEFARTMASRMVPPRLDRLSPLSNDDAEDQSQSERWLRPPGALPEPEFLQACTRCTDCQEACPYLAIRRLGPEFGDAAGTPAIIVAETPCYLCEDTPCIAACGDEALLPTAPDRVRMGSAILHDDLCYLSQGQPCDYCVKRCPLSDTAIAFGDNRLPVINTDGCAGCGVCAYLCPADAITMELSKR